MFRHVYLGKIPHLSVLGLQLNVLILVQRGQVLQVGELARGRRGGTGSARARARGRRVGRHLLLLLLLSHLDLSVKFLDCVRIYE